MSQCTLKSNRPKTVIRLGNDTPLLLALTLDTGEIINLNEVTNLSVAIVSARSGCAITPPWQVTPSGGLSIEFSANNQSIGIYGLRVQFDRLSEGFADGLQAYAWEDTNLIEVVPTSTALPSDAPNTISGVLGALMKGDKGDPGDPTELLDELSRQQADRLNEIATAQRESLTSIGARLSDEQRTTLEGLAGRLSREQAGQIAQQTERLSSEQASGLQVISDRLSSEQTQTLERQGQERATAQAEALEALDQEVNRKYDTALEGLSGKVSEAMEIQLPQIVGGKVAEAVEAQLPQTVGDKVDEATQREVPKAITAQLPAALTAQLPSQLSESLPSIIGLDDQSRLTIGVQPIGGSLKGADGRDGAIVVQAERDLKPVTRMLPISEIYSGVIKGGDPISNLRKLASAASPLELGLSVIKSPNYYGHWDSRDGYYGAGTITIPSLPTDDDAIYILEVIVSSPPNNGSCLVTWGEHEYLWSHDSGGGASNIQSHLICHLRDFHGGDVKLSVYYGNYARWGIISTALYRLSRDQYKIRGTWAQRPKTPYIGQQYIATDMRRNGVGDLPMWYNGQMWIDYEGHDVTRRYLAEG